MILKIHCSTALVDLCSTFSNNSLRTISGVLFCRFAFVEFETEVAAAAAVEEHNNEEVDGRELHIHDAGSKSPPPQSHSLYSFHAVYMLYSGDTNLHRCTGS